MSSHEQVVSRAEGKSLKKRRIGRACDLCRQKKVRCDGEQRPGQRCSNCAAYDDECTYVHTAPKRRSRPKGYVEQLEVRVAQMEDILNRLCPGSDLQRDFDEAIEESFQVSEDEGDDDEEDDTGVHSALQSPDTNAIFAYAVPPSLAHHVPRNGNTASHAQRSGSPSEDDLEPSDDELMSRLRTLEQISNGAPHTSSDDRRFFGKSSSFAMLKKAVELKNEFQVKSSPNPAPRILSRAGDVTYFPCGCPTYGSIHPWAINFPPYQEVAGEATHVFPPDDLLHDLVALYFMMHNRYTPLLHRPSFEACLASGLHRHDEDFGGIVLLVCAIGSRWSRDRRVLLEDEFREDDDDDGEEAEPWHSAGWVWFKQVRLGRKALFAAPSVRGIQLACLASMYLRGSSTAEASRTVTGIGLRLAQDIGAHRKKTYNTLPPQEAEPLKRAFWVLVWLDWTLSPQLGRPCGIQYEDFDLDLPLECNDEYWDRPDPGLNFVQPEDSPSNVTFFNCFIRLNQIQAFAMRTLYSTAKSRTILGFVGPQWEERIVAELDSALNGWMGSVPSHLQWDPRATDSTFMSQAAILQAVYCALQITIHRPFIAPRTGTIPQQLPRFPSLTICVNAARSCVHMLDLVQKKLGELALTVLHHSLLPLFNSGIVLMLNICDKMGPDRPRNVMAEMKEMSDVHTVMDLLKSIELRWHTAGRLWDMLYELAVAGDLPLPSYTHASVLRSSNAKSFKSAKTSLAHDDASNIQKKTTDQPPNAQSTSLNKSRTLPLASAQRNALNQALYPKHAHLFKSRSEDEGFNCDLSPSVFTQPSTGESSQVRRATEPSPVFAIQSGTPSDSTMHGSPKSLGKVAGWEGDKIQGAEASMSRLDVNEIATDWAPAFNLRSSIQARHQSQRGLSSGTFPLDDVEAAMNSHQPSSQPSLAFVNGNGIPSLIPCSPHTYLPLAGANASPDFMTDMLQDTAHSRETLAMLSSVPAGFDFEDWGAYIDTFGSGFGSMDRVPGTSNGRHPSNNSRT